MKKILIVDTLNVFFTEDKKNNKLVYGGITHMVLPFAKKNNLKIVNVTRMEQDKFRSLIKEYDLPSKHIYNIHDDLRKDDFKNVIEMICKYFNVERKDVVYVGTESKDLKVIEELGIDTVDCTEEYADVALRDLNEHLEIEDSLFKNFFKYVTGKGTQVMNDEDHPFEFGTYLELGEELSIKQLGGNNKEFSFKYIWVDEENENLIRLVDKDIVNILALKKCTKSRKSYYIVMHESFGISGATLLNVNPLDIEVLAEKVMTIFNHNK